MAEAEVERRADGPARGTVDVKCGEGGRVILGKGFDCDSQNGSPWGKEMCWQRNRSEIAGITRPRPLNCLIAVLAAPSDAISHRVSQSLQNWCHYGNVAQLWQLVKLRESRVWFRLVIWSQCIKVELVGRSLNINTRRKENFGHLFPAPVEIAFVLSVQRTESSGVFEEDEMNLLVCLTTFTFTFNHLADAFIQSDVQMRRTIEAIRPSSEQQYTSALTSLS